MPQDKPKSNALKQKLAKIKEKINQKIANAKKNITDRVKKTNEKITNQTHQIKLTFSNIKTRIKSIKLPKINVKLNLKKPRAEPEVETLQATPKILPKGVKVVDKYPVSEPFSQVAIIQDPKTGEHKYILDELQLDPMERGIYNRILEILLAEIQSPKEEIEDPRKFFAEEAQKIVNKYRISLGWLPDVSWYKIIYYAERDLVGFGKIDPLMHDPNIEDISCDGVNKPV